MKDGGAPWSDLNHDVFYIVMMKLGVIDFLALRGVYKSWRSVALSNMNKFMATRPPMYLDVYHPVNNQDSDYYTTDLDGRRFKIILPHSAGSFCIGVTSGYVIFFGKETHDFWLVNPIKRHALHFPDYPLYEGDVEKRIRAIIVFSESISGWVLVTLCSRSGEHKLSFCIVGKRGWNHVSSALPLIDLHVLKGKIFTLHTDCSLSELKLNVKHKCKSMLLEIMTSQNVNLSRPELLSSGENLYIVNRKFYSDCHVLKLDFGKMKCVYPEKTFGEYALFVSVSKSSAAALKPVMGRHSDTIL